LQGQVVAVEVIPLVAEELQLLVVVLAAADLRTELLELSTRAVAVAVVRLLVLEHLTEVKVVLG
jgi:hypothetical protein